MSDEQIPLRQKRKEKYAELKMAALAELERRGYEVRGKTPGQIREILKRRPRGRRPQHAKKTAAAECGREN